MSLVSGIMLCTSCAENSRNLHLIDTWLVANGFSALHPVDDLCCNGKHPQMNMRGGGYNYFKEDDFARFVISLDWDFKENVVLIIQPEEGYTRVWRGTK
jgi:hypothetical protein